MGVGTNYPDYVVNPMHAYIATLARAPTRARDRRGPGYRRLAGRVLGRGDVAAALHARQRGRRLRAAPATASPTPPRTAPTARRDTADRLGPMGGARLPRRGAVADPRRRHLRPPRVGGGRALPDARRPPLERGEPRLPARRVGLRAGRGGAGRPAPGRRDPRGPRPERARRCWRTSTCASGVTSSSSSTPRPACAGTTGPAGGCRRARWGSTAPRPCSASTPSTWRWTCSALSADEIADLVAEGVLQ